MSGEAMVTKILLAAVIGVLLTLLLLGLAFVAGMAGHGSLAAALFWQNSLLQSLVPSGNIGTSEHPMHEGSPLNFIAFLASVPFGVAVYGAAAFAFMNGPGRRGYTRRDCPGPVDDRR